MKTSFKTSSDKTECKIFFNDWYLGVVKLNIWTQKWTINPSFDLPYNFVGAREERYDSAYKAGKEMIDLYNFLFPVMEKDTSLGFGFSLEEVLSTLKRQE